ncbi:hypothetical protein SEVIR_5G290600v4 [Setaria viridis]|nr:uncharacterized protein At1g15400 [Setaria italica]XP_034596537.1 uncharacterized protein At1g15400-like [Setaria viridis]RCV26961.1 hypothetical protein SETIT_5G287600v2 [Setaria italica]TKW16288.1 hypothetical protein SEVIR_5G290600v2 [Setaria viridis]
MAGLQRSSETFRRSGSSGTVWEDKHQSASGELARPARSANKEAPAARQQQRRSGSSGHGGYRTGHVQPALDPPSPRVAACGFCSIFGKDKQLPARGAGGKGRRR